VNATRGLAAVLHNPSRASAEVASARRTISAAVGSAQEPSCLLRRQSWLAELAVRSGWHLAETQIGFVLLGCHDGSLRHRALGVSASVANQERTQDWRPLAKLGLFCETREGYVSRCTPFQRDGRSAKWLCFDGTERPATVLRGVPALR
jgi:hypothetical protein